MTADVIPMARRRERDKAQAAAQAIQAARMERIMRLLAVVKGELAWPHPAALERLEGRDWQLMDVAALTAQALELPEGDPERKRLLARARKVEEPSDTTREQLLAIYRADYARHLMTQPDPFEGLDD